MKLYCYPLENFGDRPLNTWLWPQLLPGLLDDDNDRLFVGIGSLLNDSLPAAPLKVVFGSGIGYGSRTPPPDSTWRIYAVRGPLSARALGLPPAAVITDSATLVGAVNLPALPKRYPLAYMPHWWSDAHGRWKTVCDWAGIHFIDPRAGVEQVLAELRQTELLISEALHGTIVADALRTPWIPVHAYKHILDLKWDDWCQSVGLTYQPHRLAPLYQAESVRARLRRLPGFPRGGPLARLAEAVFIRPAGTVGGALYQRRVEHNARALRRLAASAQPQLTSDQTFSRVLSRLLSALDTFKQDYQAGRVAPSAAAQPVLALSS